MHIFAFFLIIYLINGVFLLGFTLASLVAMAMQVKVCVVMP